MSRPGHLLASATLFALLASPQSSDAATLIGGDSIGPNSSLTDFLGGFVALQIGPNYLGQPAIEISQDGVSLLDSMRIIVHGVESNGFGLLFFDSFNYSLRVWEKVDYLSGQPAAIIADIGDPVGVTLVQQDANHIVPDTVFGEASFDPGSFTRPSYDFVFDLTTAHVLGHPAQLVFDTPLATGDYIVAIESNHDAGDGAPFVSLSVATNGPTPYYFQDVDGSHPRGVLLQQDPNNLSFRWGWNVFEKPAYADFDGNGIIDGLDFLKWQRGETPEMGSAEELALWEAQYGTTVPAVAATTVVPEPSSLSLLVMVSATVYFLPRQRRR